MRFKENNPWYSFRNMAPLLMTIIMIPFFVTADLIMEIFHRICFPFYKFKYVNRKKYIRIDRHKLSYLSWMEKFGCAYCGYANGLAAYWVAILGETERYWCGIRHKETKDFVPPQHHKNFMEYGDEKTFREHAEKCKKL